MERPDGVKYRAVVSRSAPSPPPSGMIVCTDPLPNDRVPMTVARFWSCKAPATISEADVEPPLIRTISGLPLIMAPCRGIEALRLFGDAAAGRDDLTLFQEGLGDRNCLVQQAARIVAQIENVAFDLVGAELSVEIVDRLFQRVGGPLVELRNADVADVAAFWMPAH